MREAIILAGGLGTRLRKVVPDLPKPMAPVAGRPFLEFLLDSLSQQQFQRVILSLGFMADKVSDHFGQHYGGLALAYVVEDKPLGTGGALRLAMTQASVDHVFVFNGDTYLDLDIDVVDRHWSQHHNPIIIGRKVPDTSRYGQLITTDGRVTGFSEKGSAGPGLINAGCYVLNRGQLDSFPLGLAFSLEHDFLADAVQHQIFDVHVTTGQFIDIGIPADFHRAQVELSGR